MTFESRRQLSVKNTSLKAVAMSPEIRNNLSGHGIAHRSPACKDVILAIQAGFPLHFRILITESMNSRCLRI
jgi:hypothetical protein